MQTAAWRPRNGAAQTRAAIVRDVPRNGAQHLARGSGPKRLMRSGSVRAANVVAVNIYIKAVAKLLRNTATSNGCRPAEHVKADLWRRVATGAPRILWAPSHQDAARVWRLRWQSYGLRGRAHAAVALSTKPTPADCCVAALSSEASAATRCRVMRAARNTSSWRAEAQAEWILSCQQRL